MNRISNIIYKKIPHKLSILIDILDDPKRYSNRYPGIERAVSC